MARNDYSKPAEGNRPLADYFWIAGVDTQQLLDAYKPIRWSYEANENISNGHDRGANDIIEEDVVAEEQAEEANSILESPRPNSGFDDQDSYQKLSDLSSAARNSIQSLDSNPRSSRSSLTIRPGKSSEDRISTTISDVDFDRAMSRFTQDRESFFLDLNFGSNTAANKNGGPKPRTRPQKIVHEELDSVPNRAFGSVRRHLSFKDMTSVRRQPSVARHVSIRTARRMSSYNSVIPAPEVLQSSPDQHPLKRKFEPVMLDKYPRSKDPEELSRRGIFPEYVPMFAFPNDINIVSSDTRPRSTWHEFSMTAADNSKIPAVCVIVWLPLDRSTADELEKRCEEWRRANMSDAERELASSLAERLALERAKLSRLLSRLPHIPSESDDREILEEEISSVEEKINVMSDMLKPLRHGAASKIEGLTDGDTGLWIPRAFGILGRDGSLANFYRQWLRAIVVPMTEGGVLRVPASSPRVGMWQPLEKYVYNLCTEAPCPIFSKTQVDCSIRELHLFAKREAANEIPGSRTTDLYPLFRALTVPNIVLLMEYVLSESRIILLSSHTAMLQLVSRALMELIWPLQWAGVYIPVLPSRLIQALEAPCPYICGIERRYEKFELPEDDFVLVDLDKNELQSTAHPPPMPKQQRRKLISLLYLAAPHHHNYGVQAGPPAYAMETFPYSAYAAELDTPFTAVVKSTNLPKLVSLSSNMFGPQAAADSIRRAPVLNSFISGTPTRGKSIDRPRTASTAKQSSHTDSEPKSPTTAAFTTNPSTPVSRNDSGYALQTSLREKRSGNFDTYKLNGSMSAPMRRKASLPFSKHTPSPSTSSLAPDLLGGSTYAPSTYAQSTLAASTIMPGFNTQHARNSDNMVWVEGHCLQLRLHEEPSTCVVCDEKAKEDFYRCTGCGFVVHGKCSEQISVVCPAAFYPDQIRAAFARCFASLLYTYRKYMQPNHAQGKKRNTDYNFNFDGFIRSLPDDHAAFIEILRQTQAFNEFIAEREHTKASTTSIALFDAIVMAKRNRTGRLRSGLPNLGLNRNSILMRQNQPPPVPDTLSDTSTHQWRIITVPGNADRVDLGTATKGRDYHTIVTRIPAKLEEDMLKPTEKRKAEPEVPQVPSPKNNVKSRKYGLMERMNGLNMNAP